MVIGETRNLETTDIGEVTRFLVVSLRQHLLYLTRYLWETDNLQKLFLVLVSSITNYGYVIGNRRNKDLARTDISEEKNF